MIGAGLVGLSVGRELLQRFPDCRLLVIEKEKEIATHQSGHNSGVIHSGIYYKPGSLKAALCTEGARAMLDFVREHGIPYQQCGKVIIATDQSELPALEELYRRGVANGVPGLRRLADQAAIRELEPHAAGIRGIHVPSAAITDYKMVATRYAKLIAHAGGEIRLDTTVTGIERRTGEIVLKTNGGDFHTAFMVNCAGLQSDRIARLGGEKLGMKIIPFRGEYYEIVPRKHDLVRGLIYPVPDPRFPFLGVHFTRRIYGGVEAGPNAVLALKREGYTRTSLSVADALETATYSGFWKMAGKYWRSGWEEMYRSWSKKAFTGALRKLLPELIQEDICAAGAGVRAQAVDQQGKLLDDFHFVDGERAVHVCNVPSPAATASLKIADVIVDRIIRQSALPNLKSAERRSPVTYVSGP